MMDRTQLKVVAQPRETPAERACRLLAEARAAAREHLADLEAAIGQVGALATAVAEGGEAYPAGIRDLCRRLAEDSEARMQNLVAVTQRIT